MPYKGRNVPANRKSVGRKGSPTMDTRPSGEVKIMDHERLEQSEVFETKYTEDIDKPAHNIWVKHHNRSYNKPDIDKPSYS
jgi:hypothetical protein